MCRASIRGAAAPRGHRWAGRGATSSLGRSALRAARESPSVTPAAAPRTHRGCLHRALDPVDRPAMGGAAAGYANGRSSPRLDAGRSKGPAPGTSPTRGPGLAPQRDGAARLRGWRRRRRGDQPGGVEHAQHVPHVHGRSSLGRGLAPSLAERPARAGALLMCGSAPRGCRRQDLALVCRVRWAGGGARYARTGRDGAYTAGARARVCVTVSVACAIGRADDLKRALCGRHIHRRNTVVHGHAVRHETGRAGSGRAHAL